MRSRFTLMPLAVAFLLIACSTALAQAGFVKGPYLQNAQGGEVVIMWETAEAGDSRVDYGPTSAYGSYVYDPTPVIVHEMAVVGLEPDSLYHYLVTSGSISSGDSTFQTAFIGSTPFRFVAYGDSRTYADDHAAVVRAIIASSPRFVLHTGDFVTEGTSAANWQREFFDPAQPLLRNTCLFPSLGNHEGHSVHYFDLFSTPSGGGIGGAQWYSFDYGTAHFVCLDTDADYSPGSAQHSWLVSDLEANDVEWIFVFTHYPAYSSGPHGGTAGVQTWLVPLFEQYGVDMVFTGHDHLYERSYKDGVHYITTGGGGANLYPCYATPNPYSEYCVSAHHHCTIDVSGLSAVMKARYNDGTVFDEVTLSHGPSPPIADFSAEPTAGNPPLLVQFTDESTGAPDTWLWDFGDMGTSAQQHPSHTYESLGNYTVSLEVSNAYGSDTETKVDYVRVASYSSHVGAIALEAAAPPRCRAQAIVTVHDQDCAPLSGVVVEITWSGCISGVQSGVTNEAGQAVFISPRDKMGGLFACCVTNLASAGHPYASADNHLSCRSLTISRRPRQPHVAPRAGEGRDAGSR